MIRLLATRIERPLSTRRALRSLAVVPTHVLIISPSTLRAIEFAQELARERACIVTSGPLTAGSAWPSEDCLWTEADIARTFSGQPTLPRSIITFPDQHPCVTPTSVMVPFLKDVYAFSTLEALLVMRHKPRTFALAFPPGDIGFGLAEIHYADIFDSRDQLFSVGNLVSRLLVQMSVDLLSPPPDWLAKELLAQKSERMLWRKAREEMKDIECLLRMQLQHRFCDRERTTAALAAVVERQRILIGSSLP